MVREIKRKSFLKQLKETISSRFFIPFTILFIVTISIPVTYLVLQHPLELREHAATIASGSMVINTDDISFQRATQQVIPQTTLNIFLLVGAGVVLLAIILIFSFLKNHME